MYETKDNSGSLFRAKERKTENHPEFDGSCKIDGVEYWISGWVNVAQSSGLKFFGLKFRKKEQQPRTGMQPDLPPADPDDDVPF